MYRRGLFFKKRSGSAAHRYERYLCLGVVQYVIVSLRHSICHVSRCILLLDFIFL